MPGGASLDAPGTLLHVMRLFQCSQELARLFVLEPGLTFADAARSLGISGAAVSRIISWS